jgi:hypothetical protein
MGIEASCASQEVADIIQETHERRITIHNSGKTDSASFVQFGKLKPNVTRIGGKKPVAVEASHAQCSSGADAMSERFYERSLDGWITNSDVGRRFPDEFQFHGPTRLDPVHVNRGRIGTALDRQRGWGGCRN